MYGYQSRTLTLISKNKRIKMNLRKDPASRSEWGKTASDTRIGIIRSTSRSKIMNERPIT